MKVKYLLAVLVLLLAIPWQSQVVEASSASYAIQWKDKKWEGAGPIMRNEEWYIPAGVLKDAYGVDLKSSEGGILQLASTSETNPAFRYQPTYYKQEVITIMYHNVEKNPTDPSFISTKQFEEQIKAMQTAGFQFISMDDYVQFMLNKKPIPNNAVLITFDDGYETFYTEAYPILKKYNVPATNFVIVSAVDNKTGRKKMTWDQMREMKKEGYSFYSHSYDSHAYKPINSKGVVKPMLTHQLYNEKTKKLETREQYLDRVKADLSLAEKRLKEELNNTYGVIAFPYGAANKDVLQIAKDLGVNVTFTVKPGINNINTRNGFRVNGGNQKIKTEDLIRQMRNRGVKQTKKVKEQVQWNGIPVEFKYKPFIASGRWYLSTKELEKQFGLVIKIDQKNKVITLSP
ncbi:polysaccharide deacetylase family protein [Paenibacillus marinisediminis]